ncbi:hypothetical protein [Oceanobacillus jeddahense]|uniref:Uncharacterized protein n=1 Tax=Oceanobacillus jeddahense TaxID=1462527 RepID=A0ABY5JWL7_9BACI|nr:hypothetical protein [Oceanobacillus jeddahense]UUI04174.1 hypothetical protein NP439_05720 [Oceanobacillus jeddahense]
MKRKGMDKGDEIVGFAISYIIVIIFLMTDVYVFFSEDSIVAKSLAVISFIGFMLLITPIIKLIPRLKR